MSNVRTLENDYYKALYNNLIPTQDAKIKRELYLETERKYRRLRASTWRRETKRVWINSILEMSGVLD